MGIYIKGLKMPRKGEYHFTLYVFEDGSAILDGATYDEPFEVVEVKEPHGRLADMDAWDDKVREVICKPCEKEGKDYGGVVCRICWVDDGLGLECYATTVIEEEKDGERN